MRYTHATFIYVAEKQKQTHVVLILFCFELKDKIEYDGFQCSFIQKICQCIYEVRYYVVIKIIMKIDC